MVYPLEGGKVDQNFEKKFPEKKFSLYYDQKNTLNPLVKSVFKSVHNYGRYWQFCDRLVCSFQYAATQCLQLGTEADTSHWASPVQLFLVTYSNLIVILQTFSSAEIGSQFFHI